MAVLRQRPSPDDRGGSIELDSSRVRRRGIAVDTALAIVLALAAYVIRRTGLPHNGLWHDDAWVAAGAIHGHPLQIFMVGSAHPGFTAVLMTVSRLTGARSDAMAYPAFVAGVLGAPLIFLALRRFGYARSIAALCAAALVVADVPILYSTRVKPYSIDVIVVVGLAFVLPRLARSTWGWRIAIAWVAFAVIVGSITGFALVATAIAAAVLVLYAESDRTVRIAALVGQGATQALLYLEMQRSSDLAKIEQEQAPNGAHLNFSWNPIKFGGELLKHFRRVVHVYPAGPGWLLTVIVVVVLVGLVTAATNRRRAAEAMRAQYMLLILVFAIVASLLHRFPFGPAGGSFLSRPERATLWLVPVVAVGLAAALQRVRGATEHTRWMRLGFDAVVFLLALVVVAPAVHKRTFPYAFSGSKEATHFLEAHLGEHDVVLLPGTSTMTYAVETSTKVTLHATPRRTIGFAPTFEDRRIKAIGAQSLIPATPVTIREIVRAADRVFVFLALSIGPEPQAIADDLATEGFEPTQTLEIGATKIVVWRKPTRPR